MGRTKVHSWPLIMRWGLRFGNNFGSIISLRQPVRDSWWEQGKSYPIRPGATSRDYLTDGDFTTPICADRTSRSFPSCANRSGPGV